MQVFINGQLQAEYESVQPNTKLLEQEQDARAHAKMPLGAAMPADEQVIRLHIGNQTISLPPGESVKVGRGRNLPRPSVDLSAFNADDKGVSRLHVQFIRRGQLVFISDLNSTNGTFLNGHKLIPESERLVRNADHLRMGALEMIVQFDRS